MDVPDLGGHGISLGAILLIAAAVLLGLPALNKWLQVQAAAEKSGFPIRAARV